MKAKQSERANSEKVCNEMEQWQRITNESGSEWVWFDDNKSGKYKYAIFINECALQCQCAHNVYVWFIILSCGFLHRKKTFVIYAPKAQIHTDAKENREWKRKREKVRTNGFWFSIEYDNTFSFFERAKVTINDTRTQTQMKSMANNKNKLYQIYHPWAHHLH